MGEPLTVPCPSCKAATGKPCRVFAPPTPRWGGGWAYRKKSRPHIARVRLANIEPQSALRRIASPCDD